MYMQMLEIDQIDQIDQIDETLEDGKSPINLAVSWIYPVAGADGSLRLPPRLLSAVWCMNPSSTSLLGTIPARTSRAGVS